MNLIQRLVERLRPILNLKTWDYCVIWKLDDDQRFLEWMDCCCVGSEESIENGGEDLLFSVASAPSSCRDVMFQHLRTKSCDLLANLPSSMPLDSGIYAETLMSNQARWLNCSGIIPDALQETAGTRVLIPLPIGLAELFVAKQVPEDQQIIDFVTSQFNMLLIEQQSMINSSNMDNLADENDIHDKDLNNLNPFEPPIPPASTPESLSLPYDISVDRIRLCNNSSMNFLEQFNYSAAVKNGSCFEGSNDPFQSNGFQDMDALQKSLMSRPGKRHADAMEPLSKEEQGNDRDTFRQETARSESMSDCDLNEQEDDDQCRRTGKGPQAKNLAAERRRRKKLNERIYSLRSLVPKITKLDRASVLSDAIDFVMELQQQVKDLQHELEQSEHDEGATNTGTSYNQNNDRSEILNQNGIHFGSRDENDNEKGLNGFHVGAATEASKQNMESNTNDNKLRQMEPQVEVAQLDGNKFFVKVFCEHKAGGLVRLMEALSSLGLEVTSVNVTSFRYLVSNIFQVEKRDSEMVQADHVRDSLMKITRNPARDWPEMAKVSENENIGMNYNYQEHGGGGRHHHHNHQIGSHSPHFHM